MERTTTTEPRADITCGLCVRTAAAIDRSGMPLCARHATILVTVTDRQEPEPKEAS